MHRPSGNTVEIVAHRGASVEAPENTLASVDLAWQLGADAVEIDVRLSADGHLVVMHDETLLRTAGIDRRISEMTLSRLRSLDVGTWKGPQWRDERVIELSSVVATVPAGRRLLIELKTGTRAGMNAAIKEAILAALQKTLKRCNAAAESIVLISLSGELIRDAKRRFSHHQALWVVRQTAAATGITEAVSSGWLPDLNDIIRTSSDYGLDGVDLFHSPAITIEAVRQLASAGLSTCVWTVNSVDECSGCAPACHRTLRIVCFHEVESVDRLRERMAKSPSSVAPRQIESIRGDENPPLHFHLGFHRRRCEIPQSLGVL